MHFISGNIFQSQSFQTKDLNFIMKREPTQNMLKEYQSPGTLVILCVVNLVQKGTDAVEKSLERKDANYIVPVVR